MAEPAEKKGVDLDELQQETEKLLKLLQDRHPGLITWNMALLENLGRLNQLTECALR